MRRLNRGQAYAGLLAVNAVAFILLIVGTLIMLRTHQWIALFAGIPGWVITIIAFVNNLAGLRAYRKAMKQRSQSDQ